MRFIAAAILFAMAGMAQQTPDPKDSGGYRIEGTVVDAETGQAIEGARVQVFGTMAGETVSGQDGHFSIPLNDGRGYALWTSLKGYLSDSAAKLSECSPCTITVRLHARAVFRGRVVAADTKEPLARVIVEALAATGSSRILTSIPDANVRTDQNGQFILTLPPGQYFFRFTPPAGDASLIVVEPLDRPTPEYARQFWPGGDDYKNTSPFTVMAETDFRLPDVWIPALPRFRISGAIQSTMCQAGDAYTVSIANRRGTTMAPFRSMLVRCGAEFVFADLAPGRYQISLLPKDGGEALRQVEVVVTDSDLQRNFGS